MSPSIKFEPFTTIKMQKLVKSKFIIFWSSIKFKKSSLSETILKSKKNKKEKITIDCNKNLLTGECNNPRSDNNPNKKINVKNILKILLPSVQKKIYDIKIIKPPT